MDANKPTFGYNIAAIEQRILELGLTNNEVARRADLSPTTIANVLGLRTRKRSTVRQIIMAIGLNPVDIVVRKV